MSQGRNSSFPVSANGKNGADMAILERQLESLQLQQQQQRNYFVQNNYSVELCSMSQLRHSLIVDSYSDSSDQFLEWQNRAGNCVGVEDLTKFVSDMAVGNNCSPVMDHRYGKNSNCQAAVAAEAAVAVEDKEKRDDGALMRDTESYSGRSKRKAEYVDAEEYIDKRSKAEAEVMVLMDSRVEKRTNFSENSTDATANYTHVRARRGQATDNHSLAERARRKKIRMKMKCLQDLVPGCNKTTGKAGMLDEIINYVQSLQSQVEFLSMKLAVMNPMLPFNINNFSSKEFPAYMASLPAAPGISPEGRIPTSSPASFSIFNESPTFSHIQSGSPWDADMSSLHNLAPR